jgi:hypothetical protein
MASDIPITVGHTSPNMSTVQKKVKIKKKDDVLVADFDDPLFVTVKDGSTTIVPRTPLGSNWMITIDK